MDLRLRLRQRTVRTQRLTTQRKYAELRMHTPRNANRTEHRRTTCSILRTWTAATIIQADQSCPSGSHTRAKSYLPFVVRHGPQMHEPIRPGVA